VTSRRDLDALLDEMEPEYARATTPLEQTNTVATAALRCAYLLADTLDATIARVGDLDRAELHQQLAELRAEIASLSERVELLMNGGRKRRPSRR
jgi:hypothetical protein